MATGTGLEAISSVQIANIAEVIVSDEVKQMQSNEKRARLLQLKDEVDEALRERLLPVGISIRSSTLGIPTGVGVIQQTRHVFIRKAGDEFVQKFFDLPNRFELLDTDTNRILYAGETYENFDDGNGCLGASTVTFDLCLLGVNGGGVLSIKSNKIGVVTISDFHETLGTVTDASGDFCYANHRKYSVRDEHGYESFKIHATRQIAKKDWEFEILDKDTTAIGYMRKTWNDDDEPEHAPLEDDVLFGVCFPQDMEAQEKILLVGAMFTIYFQHHHEGGHGSVVNGRCVLLAYVLITVIVVGGLIGFAIWLSLRSHR